MRNRHKTYICIAFVLMSGLSLLAQSARMDVQRWDDFQPKAGNAGWPLLTATLVEAPSIGGGSESDLPDAPTATSSDAPTADPAASPAMKRDSRGAPPSAQGGPLWVDRTVADRNYLVVNSGMFGASILNAELTMRCLNKHPSCNDVPPSLQSRAAVYGIGIPADLAVAYLTYCLKRKHNHMWYVPAAVVAGGNIFLGMRAYRWTEQ